MTKVNLSNQKLTTFPIRNDARNITQLVLTNNQISTIPPQIQQYTALQHLRLDNNKLKKIVKEFSHLINLVHLYLPNNEIQELTTEISNLINLQTLILNHNHLIFLSEEIGKLINLNHLQLNHNKLEELPEDIGNLENLVNLYLDNNKLEFLPSNLSNLDKLQNLALRNNKLKRLPESFKNFKVLNRIFLEGNPLPLPENHQNLPAKEVIKYVLEKQPPPEPEINTKKIYIYRHISNLPEFQAEYQEKLNTIIQDRKLEFTEIEKVEDLEQELTVVFFLVPFDIAEKPLLEMIEKCISKEQTFFILMQKKQDVTGDLINIEKGKEISDLHTKIQQKYTKHIRFYKTLEDVGNYVIDALKKHIPNIILQNLSLKNIGHFSELELNFDDNLTCLVGENGSGKTTILRALALSIMGIKTSKLEQKKIEKLLKIKGYDDKNQIIFQEAGEIKLTYQIDGDEKENSIHIRYENGEIELSDSGDFEILANRYEFKSLIVGFAQIREHSQIQNNISNTTRPNINDLLPLVHNVDDQRLKNFNNWIVNLYGEGNRKMLDLGIKDKSQVEEFILIDKIFEVISKLSKHDIAFQNIQNFSPAEILVKTYDSPQGIPLTMISQGFQVLISWIGYFLQRLIEAYPLNRNNFMQERAIILIDEIDSYIHPKWQLDLLENLQEIFPNTQFIVSTHSPLVILNRQPEEIIELRTEENEIKVHKRETDIPTSISLALMYYFNLERVVSKDVHDKLTRYNQEFLVNGNSEKAREIEKELREMYINTPISDKRYLKFLQLMKQKGLLIPEKINEVDIENWDFTEEEWAEIEKDFQN